VTAAVRLDAAPVIEGAGAADVNYLPRLTPTTWPQTGQSREATFGRLIALSSRSSSAEVRGCARRGLTVLLDWLAAQPGGTWQSRWIASGADRAGQDWVALPARYLAGPSEQLTARVRTDLVTGVRMLIVGQVIRPGYPWLLRYRPSVLLEEARQLLDPAGFARLRAHCQATGRSNPLDCKSALNRTAWILLNKGGQIRDITVGDCVELHAALREHQCKSAVDKPLYYTLLRETGVLPPGSPPRLKAFRMAGQLSPAQLVGKYQIQSPAMRQLLTAYLAERAPQLDYASLIQLATTLCCLFWQDLERHHPGIDSLRLDPEVAVAWKERLRLLHDKHGNPVGQRASPRSKLLIVRAFYQDIARWAAEDPGRWGPWVAPCPIKASECSLFKETKQRKAAMDQRTRARLPVLPALIHTAETGRQVTRERLEAVLATAPGQTVHVHGAALVRRPGQAGRVYVTDLATGVRRDLTYEEERAFWAWAIVEVLRHTGVRVEEMAELTHHSFAAYTLPSTGEVVPMLQIAPSKTDTERLLLVSPELGEVLAEIIHRVRNGRQTLPLVAAYDPYERTWGAPMPYLFQRQRGPEHHVISRAVIRRYLNDLLASSGLTDASNNPLVFTPHDFRRLFATDALRSGLPPHIAAKILGHYAGDFVKLILLGGCCLTEAGQQSVEDFLAPGLALGGGVVALGLQGGAELDGGLEERARFADGLEVTVQSDRAGAVAVAEHPLVHLGAELAHLGALGSCGQGLGGVVEGLYFLGDGEVFLGHGAVGDAGIDHGHPHRSMPQEGGYRLKAHAAVDGLGGQRVPEPVGADVADPGGLRGLGDGPVDAALADALAVLDEEVGGAQAGGPCVEPGVEEVFELGVQRDVAVGAELAERHVQPVGGADLHDGVDGEVEELAFAQAGAGQELHGQADERVGVGAGGLQQLGERAVVQEPGQRLVAERQVAGEDQHRGGHVAAVPLGEPFEAGAQGAEVLGEADPGQFPAAGRWPAGQVQFVGLDVTAAQAGDAADLGGAGGQPAGELAQHALDADHGRGPQRQAHLGDVAGQGGRQQRGRRLPLRGPLGRAVRAGLAGSGVEHAEVKQGGLQSEQRRAQRPRAVAAGVVTADGGSQRLPALVDDRLGHLTGGQPGQCRHLGQRRPLQAGHGSPEAEPGGGLREPRMERPVMMSGDFPQVGPAGHQVVRARTQPPGHDEPADHPPVLQRQGALVRQGHLRPPGGTDAGEEHAGDRGNRVAGEHPGLDQVGAVGADQVLHAGPPGR